MTKDELIAALEKATGPSRELDAAIGALLPPPPKDNGAVVWWPYYTASIDAALALAPEGAVWRVMTDFELPGRAHIHVCPPGIDSLPENYNADAATPAIALCIAALRARP